MIIDVDSGAGLLPFQRRFIRATRTHAASFLSLARGNGKSTLAAGILRACLTPGTSWHVPGAESFVLAGGMAQARRTTWAILEASLRSGADAADFRIHSTVQACRAVHLPSRASCSIIASSSKRALGLVDAPVIIGDEPGAWENGEELWETLWTGLDKPQRVPTRLVMIGTQSPALPGDWWPHLLRHPASRQHSTLIEGDPERWDRAPVIRRANPLKWRLPDIRCRLMERRNDAWTDPRKADAFRRQNLNIPGVDIDVALLTPVDVERVLDRSCPPRDGRPVVGVDLGDSPSWSAAVAIWPSGRVEAMAATAGIPDLDAQERRDQARRGSYRRMVENGVLRVATGLHSTPPSILIDPVLAHWDPVVIIGDTYRRRALVDAVAGRCRMVFRTPRWRESSEDIAALRVAARDGNMAWAASSRMLLIYGVSRAEVRSDDQGNKRMVKAGGAQSLRRRDDIAQALTFAAGAHQRRPPQETAESILGGTAAPAAIAAAG